MKIQTNTEFETYNIKQADVQNVYISEIMRLSEVIPTFNVTLKIKKTTRESVEIKKKKLNPFSLKY